MLSKQTIFDKVVDHARKQGCRSRSQARGGTCYYRHPDNGLKCFIGALMPDNLYQMGMDGMNEDGSLSGIQDMSDATALFDKYPEVMEQSGLSDDGDTKQFLMDLQSVHDNWPAEDWDMKLARLATHHNLEMSK